MRAYSTDLKERVVRAVADGQSMLCVPLAAASVAVTTVKRAVVQERATGSLERKPIPGRPREFTRDQEAILLARLQAAPDATVGEHCAWWAEQQGYLVSVTTMWRAIRRLGWTHTKNRWQESRARRGGAERLARGCGPARPGAARLCRVMRGTNIALTRLCGWAPHDR